VRTVTVQVLPRGSRPPSSSARELLHVEGIPLGLPNEAHSRNCVDLASENDRQHLLGGLVQKRAERDLGRSMSVAPERTQAERRAFRAGGELCGEDDRDRCALREVENRFGEVSGRRVRPMHVLQRDDNRSFPRERFEPADVRLSDVIGVPRVVVFLDP